MSKKLLNYFNYSKQKCMYHMHNQLRGKIKNVKTDQPVYQYPTSKDYKRIYVWGFSNTGALGIFNSKLENTKLIIKNPKRLGFAEKHKVMQVACGFGFTLFAVKSSDDVKLYGTGINTDSQIGYHVSKGNIPLELLYYPSPIKLPFPTNKDTEIVKVAAGRAHVLVLTTEGLFTLGSNSYGQCGREIIHDEKYANSSVIHFIPDIQGQKIIDVQCGQDHSLVLTDKGQVYSCGWGADGQTGLGHCDNTANFTRISGDIEGEKIIKLSGVGDCILALNDKNEVFGWGNSEYSQLDNNLQQITIPKKLPHCSNLGKIVEVAAGGSFCMLLNDEGFVFVWGCGMLGRGLDIQYPKPTLVHPTLFGCNDFQLDNKVVDVKCGVGHLAAITNYGDLFMWGRNRNGCLGIGHMENQCVPIKVTIGASVRSIACGLDHNIAICEPFI